MTSYKIHTLGAHTRIFSKGIYNNAGKFAKKNHNIGSHNDNFNCCDSFFFHQTLQFTYINAFLFIFIKFQSSRKSRKKSKDDDQLGGFFLASRSMHFIPVYFWSRARSPGLICLLFFLLVLFFLFFYSSIFNYSYWNILIFLVRTILILRQQRTHTS